MLIKIYFPFTFPDLAVLEDQFKHFCCASNETDSDAVQHHPFTAVEHIRRQMLGLNLTDKLPKTGCDCLLRSGMLQDCKKAMRKRNEGRGMNSFSWIDKVDAHSSRSREKRKKFLWCLGTWQSEHTSVPSTADLCSPLTACTGRMLFCSVKGKRTSLLSPINH